MKNKTVNENRCESLDKQIVANFWRRTCAPCNLPMVLQMLQTFLHPTSWCNSRHQQREDHRSHTMQHHTQCNLQLHLQSLTPSRMALIQRWCQKSSPQGLLQRYSSCSFKGEIGLTHLKSSSAFWSRTGCFCYFGIMIRKSYANSQNILKSYSIREGVLESWSFANLPPGHHAMWCKPYCHR